MDLSVAVITSTPEVPDGLPLAQRRRAYIALAAATAMAVLDGTIANVALPTIGREMHATPAMSVWVVSGFQMALTAALFTWSSFGQSRGLAFAWRYAVATFTTGSLLCALSHNLPLLIAARVVQGIGGAGIISSPRRWYAASSRANTSVARSEPTPWSSRPRLRPARRSAAEFSPSHRGRGCS